MLHTIPQDRIEGLIDGGRRGLSAAEVAERRARYGNNDILGSPSSGWGSVLHDTIRDPMIWFLVATALLFAWLGEYVEASILAVALAPIVGMDAYLHRRTQASTEGLAGRLAASARVLRNGATAEIPATELVPGDLVLVTESQPFPADGVLVAGENLQTDESALTGESMPVRKRPLSPEHARESAGDGLAVEHDSWGAAGTRLLTGEARMRIVFTGRDTLYGQIVRSAQAGGHERTPLQHALSSLVVTLLTAASLMCVALAVTRYYQGHGVVDALLSAVTLAVAALPEEFPVVLTFFLSVGVYRLARRQALVRRAVVVENIGRVSCICTDKTGTITEGRLELAHLLPAHAVSENELLYAAAIASRARSADPMDTAVLDRAGLVIGERAASFPFTEDRRREVGIVPGREGAFVAGTKGAPEVIFGMTGIAPAERSEWERTTHELASSGHKVIACAIARLEHWPGGEPDRNYRFLGLLAFEDPLRANVRESVARARSAGIRVIMVTGDHPATAQAIATEAGIGGNPPRVIDGQALPAYLRSNDALGEIDVVARSVPAQKLDLVRALQASGEIVAVTGDGVNDVPALQGADVGIAMGERGTRSAREVASIVLLDDNFSTIMRAIAEGRQLFDNLKLSFAYLLVVHIPLVLTAAFVPFAGFPLLYLPVHIVWLELIIHPTALLVFQQLPASNEIRPVRRRRRLRFFDTREWVIIGIAGLVVTIVIVFGYIRGLGPDQNVEHARSMAIVTLIAASVVSTAGLSRLRTRGAIIAILATLASVVGIVQFSPVAALVHVSPLHVDDWAIALGAGLIPGALSLLISRRPRSRAPDRPHSDCPR